MPDPYVTGIFKKFSLLYGHIWDSQVSARLDERLQTWAEELYGIQPDEIKHGLGQLPEKPPSVIEFRKLCLQKRPLNESHKPFPPGLPKPKADAAVAADAIKNMREILRGTSKA